MSRYTGRKRRRWIAPALRLAAMLAIVVLLAGWLA